MKLKERKIKFGMLDVKSVVIIPSHKPELLGKEKYVKQRKAVGDLMPVP